MANFEGKWGIMTVGINLCNLWHPTEFLSWAPHSQGQESSPKNAGILFGNIGFPLGNGDDLCVCVSALSCFRHVQLSATLWTIARQAPLSMGFSRQEYWSGLPFPLPGDLSDPGIEPKFLTFPALAGGFFTARATWEAHGMISVHC